MHRRSGLVTGLMFLLAVASVFVGILFFAGSGEGGLLGLITGGFSLSAFINELIGTLVANIWNIFLLLGTVGIVIVVVRNAGQDDPMWQQDFKFLGLGAVGFVILMLLVSFGSGVQQETTPWQADVVVTAHNNFIGGGEIRGVNAENFQQSSTTSVFPPLSSVGFGTFDLLGNTFKVETTVTCDDGYNDTRSDQIEIGEGNTGEVRLRFTGLSKDASCDADARLLFAGEEHDTGSDTFTVQ